MAVACTCPGGGNGREGHGRAGAATDELCKSCSSTVVRQDCSYAGAGAANHCILHPAMASNSIGESCALHGHSTGCQVRYAARCADYVAKSFLLCSGLGTPWCKGGTAGAHRLPPPLPALTSVPASGSFSRAPSTSQCSCAPWTRHSYGQTARAAMVNYSPCSSSSSTCGSSQDTRNLRMPPPVQGHHTGALARRHSQGAWVTDTLAPKGPLVLFLHTGSVSKG